MSKKRLPNTTNISFEFNEGEGILLLLNELGIAASSGSACTSGSLEPSYVLRAIGVPFTAAHGSIRYSLSRYNTMKEVDYVIENLPPVIERHAQYHPTGRTAVQPLNLNLNIIKEDIAICIYTMIYLLDYRPAFS